MTAFLYGPVDPSTRSRAATAAEIAAAAALLRDLECSSLRVVLVPAPSPSFDGHKVRAVEDRNPEWFRRFHAAKGTAHRPGGRVKRSRVIRALYRVLSGRVRGNGYEREILNLV